MPAQFHDLWWRPCQVVLLLLLVLGMAAAAVAVAVAQKKSGGDYCLLQLMMSNVVYMDDISCATMSNYLTIHLSLSFYPYIYTYPSMMN